MTQQQDRPRRRPQRREGTRLRVRLLALLLPLAALVLVDAGLRAASLTPPENPLVFFERTRAADFSPFVESAGLIRVRPDWIARSDGLEGSRGTRSGRYFIQPAFRDSAFPVQKAPGEIRIFALGGSTTFGLYVGARLAYPAKIEQQLPRSAGARPVHVINLGCAGWASDRVANLLSTVLKLDPDLVLVYTGHNELLDGNVTRGRLLELAQRARARLLSASTLVSWLDHAMASPLRQREAVLIREEVAALEAGMAMTYEPGEVPESERRLPSPYAFQRAAGRFAANIDAMIREAGAARVPIVFVLPVRNLMLPPQVSAHEAGFDAGAEFDAALARAAQARAGSRFEEELAHLDAALGLSRRHALLHYRRGRALTKLGRVAEAFGEFEQASDLDVRTHRITSQLERALIETVETRGGRWIDLRPVFHAELDVVTAGRDFIDHVHPTERGHQKIAEQVLPVLRELLPPGVDGEGRA